MARAWVGRALMASCSYRASAFGSIIKGSWGILRVSGAAAWSVQASTGGSGLGHSGSPMFRNRLTTSPNVREVGTRGWRTGTSEPADPKVSPCTCQKTGTYEKSAGARGVGASRR